MSFHPLDPNAVDRGGVLYNTILSPGHTGGAMTIMDSLSPFLSGPPRNVHEAFVILTDTCEFWLDGARSNLRFTGPPLGTQ